MAMQDAQARLEQLYIKWWNKTATPPEVEEFRALLEAGVAKEQLAPAMQQLWDSLQEEEQAFSHRQKQQLADTILQQWPAEPVVARQAPVRRLHHAWIAAAALLLVLIGAGTYKWILQPAAVPSAQEPAAGTAEESIQPGRPGAILTLADGRRIVLDTTANGLIDDQQGTAIRLQNNQLIYEAATTGHTAVFNTMATPKGRQFQLRLPDGTKVWLNAASSIRYPVAFPAGERRVELSGEAYFEVAHEAARPFRVQTAQQVVQALGTSFNVNAYENETGERATLIEGKVKISGRTTAAPAGNALLLGPGQQAVIDMEAQEWSVRNNRAEAAIAWKNGYFYLEDMPFGQVMKQLERWYDIQVQYESGVPDLHFVGGLSRNMTLEALLRALQVSEVHFKMEPGRRLVVYK